jgi:hypothetical protein
MFASLGVAIGAVLLLVFLIVRLVVARRRNVIKSLSTSSQSSSSSVEKQQQQQQQQPQQHFVAASLPPKSSETVALLSPVNSSPPCISTGGSGSSETSLSRQRRRPDKVHFAQLPSDAELTATRPSQGTSVTDDTVMTPGSAATSLNDVFLPSSVSTPSATQSQGVISRQWQMSADVIDDVDDVTVGVLLRNDTSRGSFYNNPYRHDTIDGRIRTSRVK